ncbi:MAG: M2 family metallopeptidase [Deltaproteobacteria bacterium]|nr:M2 family metallopeptidase [Deltaproteobacteria bacterium]
MSKISKQVQTFLKDYLAQRIPLETALNETWWKLAVNDNPDLASSCNHLEYKFQKLHSSAKHLATIKEFLQNEGIKKDKLQFRQLQILQNTFGQEQYSSKIKKEIIKLSSQLEYRYNNYRPEFKKNTKLISLSHKRIISVLKHELNPDKKQKLWELSKNRGIVVGPDDFARLVTLRNRSAREAGFKNFFEMKLLCNELDPETVCNLMDNLQTSTNSFYQSMKKTIDKKLASRFSIKASKLMPWHYGDLFFQELPQAITIDFDNLIRKNPLYPVKKFLESLNFNLDRIYENSDFYEKPGKTSPAFCMDIDRKGSIRILTSLQKNFSWLETILHEFAHAIYFDCIDTNLPWLLKTHAHNFITEGTALWMQNFAFNQNLLSQIQPDFSFSAAPTQIEQPRLDNLNWAQKLIFIRWALVVFNFEKNIYQGTGQNWQNLWWELVQKIQLINPPPDREDKCDYLAKIHIISNPVYYHNYLLGLIFSAQLDNTIHSIHKKHLGKFSLDWFSPHLPPGTPNASGSLVGNFLKDKLFHHGKKHEWSKLIEKCTGSKLKLDFLLSQIEAYSFFPDLEP